jgi:hypothetical protein
MTVIDIDGPDKRRGTSPAPAPAAQPAEKPTLIGLDRDELAQALAGIGVPERQLRMRVAQMWHWLYVRGVSDFADMLNVSKDLRAQLSDAFTIARPEIVSEQIPTTARASGCSASRRAGLAARWRSKRSISRKRGAERFACPRRWAAR